MFWRLLLLFLLGYLTYKLIRLVFTVQKIRRMAHLDPNNPDDRVELGLEKDITAQAKVIDTGDKEESL